MEYNPINKYFFSCALASDSLLYNVFLKSSVKNYISFMHLICMHTKIFQSAVTESEANTHK